MSSLEFLYALAGVVAVSCISFAGVFTLSVGEKTMRYVVFLLVSASVGALFGDAFLHLLPEAMEFISDTHVVAGMLFTGILSFFILEKFLRWHHSHTEGEIDEMHPEHNVTNPLSTIVLVGDGVHNMIDGVIIGTGFAVSTEVGIATLAAIALHEIPQEIGDFGVLIHAGLSRARALMLNFFSALLAIVGVVIAAFLDAYAENILYYALAFAAGGFIYIAGSDLVPELHKTRDPRKSFTQIACIILGFGAMLALTVFE